MEGESKSREFAGFRVSNLIRSNKCRFSTLGARISHVPPLSSTVSSYSTFPCKVKKKGEVQGRERGGERARGNFRELSAEVSVKIGEIQLGSSFVFYSQPDTRRSVGIRGRVRARDAVVLYFLYASLVPRNVVAALRTTKLERRSKQLCKGGKREKERQCG